MVAAAPAYWAAHGVPQHPSELARHVCLPLRSVDGTVMDLWSFTRAGETVAVRRFGGYWLDIGRPDDYARAIDEFSAMRARFLDG